MSTSTSYVAHTQSYFPPVPAPFSSRHESIVHPSTTNTISGEGAIGNIDDIVYRYSAEHDRDQSQSQYQYQYQDVNNTSHGWLDHPYLPAGDTGTPAIGIYSQDGLWDEEDSETLTATSTSRRVSGSTATSHGKSVASFGSSFKSRARSTTISSASPGTGASSGSAAKVLPSLPATAAAAAGAEKHASGMWNWAKRPSMGNLKLAAAGPEGDGQEHGVLIVEKKRSKSKIRGKGRKGELMVHIAPDEGRGIPPLPSTPSSFLTAASTPTTSSPFMSPPPPQTNENVYGYQPAAMVPQQSQPLAKTTKPSAWKRSMTKIFKSKSSTALRETFNANINVDPVAHPVPALPAKAGGAPSETTHTRGKGYGNGNGYGNHEYPFLMSPPPSASSQHSFLSQPPLPNSLPADPFASSLDLSSNTLPRASPGLSNSTTSQLGSPAFSITRPKLPRHSPSLKDLKNLLPGGGAKKLTKTKSLANLAGTGTNTSVGVSTSEPPPLPSSASRDTAIRKFASVADLKAEPPLLPPVRLPILPRSSSFRAFLTGHAPALSSAPTESPPLLPPNPPYFPPTAGGINRNNPPASLSSIPASISSGPSSPLTPPPTSPLPPTPSSSTSLPLGTVPLAGDSPSQIQRSASGAVLLPRSRSTSMSLKAPPTSSSFFDLYEQLGIWPGQEKDKLSTDKGQNQQRNSTVQEAKAGETKAEVSVVTTHTGNERSGADTPPREHTDTEVFGHENEENQPISSTPRRDQLELTTSISATFSSASWEAAINAFPMIEQDKLQSHSKTQSLVIADAADMEAPKMSLDFGLPYVGDEEVMDISSTSAHHDFGDNISISTHGYSSVVEAYHNATTPNPSLMGHTTTYRSTSSGQGQGQLQSSSRSAGQSSYSQAQKFPAGTGLGISHLTSMSRRGGNGSGSGSSSRDSSNSRRSRNWNRAHDASGHSSAFEESESEGDDVPLSHLHPQAQAAREEAAKRKLRRREKKAALGAVSRLEAHSSTRGRGDETRQTHANALKVKGRNPGGGTSWDGEGGVPSDVLLSKLNSLAIRTTTTTTTTMSTTRALKPQRSFTGPLPSNPQSSSVTRSHTTTASRAGSSKIEQHYRIPHQPVPHSFTPRLGADSGGIAPSSLQPSPVIYSSSTGAVPSPHLGHGANRESHIDRYSSSGPGGGTASAGQASRSTTITSQRSATVSRSNTRTSHQSLSTSNHGRAAASSSHTQAPSSHQAQRTSAASSNRDRAMKVPCVVQGSGKQLELEAFGDTNARDLISRMYANGELDDAGPGMSWVVCEVFGEIGCERQLREYESIQAVIRGWDSSSRANALVFRKSNRSLPTLARSVPATAPMIGGYVQYESKKGKWSKRWLETRGGQVFMAKNEKNKDEVQINTSFVDVYLMSRAYKAPNSFVFVLKRSDPAAAFENPNDYMFVFSAEESMAWKLVTAIYDAKSYTIGQTSPHLVSQIPTAVGTHHLSLSRKEPAPLVNLAGEEKERSAFTGKGLLKV